MTTKQSKMRKLKSTESVVRDIKRRTKRKFAAEEKIRIVLEGLKGEESISAIFRKEGISNALYYRWSKDFLEAGKKRLLGDTMREANTSEVKSLKEENTQLKELTAELMLQVRVLKKSMNGDD
jgi:transposase